jgi:hypothetical protein
MNEKPSPIDFLVMALSPILIIGVVVSLAWFLAEVFYRGVYEDRLLYLLFCYGFGIVLAARIAVVMDRKRSLLYGMILAFVSWLALNKFVDYTGGPLGELLRWGANGVIVLVVWWASSRLVWDCTHIDERRESSGKGLLAALGWEKQGQELAPKKSKKSKKSEAEKKYPAGLLGWFDRYDDYRKNRDKQPHTPGLWVVWFALAALPIFGLGQSLIPPEDTSRRQFAFFCAAVYVGSSLGLLLTTSFLGLRRYLRQRNSPMPASMTATWFGVGLIMILLFLGIAAFLPRPYSESSVMAWRGNASTKLNASSNAQLKDGAGKGEGNTGRETTQGDGSATAKDGDPKNPSSGKGDKNSSQKGNQKGDSSSNQKGDQKGSSDSKGENPNNPNNPNDPKQKGDANDPNTQSDRSQGREPSQQTAGQNRGGGSSSLNRISSSLSSIGNVLKWIIFAVVAIVVVIFLLRGGLKYLAHFMPWAKNLLASFDAWWKSLFGNREPKLKQRNETELPEIEADSRRPFSSFADPFATGNAYGMSPEELVEYSFSALESWAYDQGQGRAEAETATEFALRLAKEFEQARYAPALANLVSQASYSPRGLSENSRQMVEQFWKSLLGGIAPVESHSGNE